MFNQPGPNFRKKHVHSAQDRADCLGKIITNLFSKLILIIDFCGSLSQYDNLWTTSTKNRVWVHSKTPPNMVLSEHMQIEAEKYRGVKKTFKDGTQLNFSSCSCVHFTVGEPGCRCCDLNFLRKFDYVFAVMVDVAFHISDDVKVQIYDFYADLGLKKFESLFVLSVHPLERNKALIGPDMVQANVEGEVVAISQDDPVVWSSPVRNTSTMFSGGIEVGGLFYVFSKVYSQNITVLLRMTRSTKKSPQISFNPVAFPMGQVLCVVGVKNITGTTQELEYKHVVLANSTIQDIISTFGSGTLTLASLFARTKSLYPEDPFIALSISVRIYAVVRNLLYYHQFTNFIVDIDDNFRDKSVKTKFLTFYESFVNEFAHPSDEFNAGAEIDPFYLMSGQKVGKGVRKTVEVTAIVLVIAAFVGLCPNVLPAFAPLAVMGGKHLVVAFMKKFLVTEAERRLLDSKFQILEDSTLSAFNYQQFSNSNQRFVGKGQSTLMMRNVAIPAFYRNDQPDSRHICYCGQEIVLHCPKCYAVVCSEHHKCCQIGFVTEVSAAHSVKLLFGKRRNLVPETPVEHVLVGRPKVIRDQKFNVNVLIGSFKEVHVVRPFEDFLSVTPKFLTLFEVKDLKPVGSCGMVGEICYFPMQIYLMKRFEQGFCLDHLTGASGSYLSSCPRSSCKVCSPGLFSVETPSMGLPTNVVPVSLACGSWGPACACDYADSDYGTIVRFSIDSFVPRCRDLVKEIKPLKFSWWELEEPTSVGSMIIVSIKGLVFLIKILSVTDERIKDNWWGFCTSFVPCAKKERVALYGFRQLDGRAFNATDDFEIWMNEKDHSVNPREEKLEVEFKTFFETEIEVPDIVRPLYDMIPQSLKNVVSIYASQRRAMVNDSEEKWLKGALEYRVLNEDDDDPFAEPVEQEARPTTSVDLEVTNEDVERDEDEESDKEQEPDQPKERQQTTERSEQQEVQDQREVDEEEKVSNQSTQPEEQSKPEVDQDQPNQLRTDFIEKYKPDQEFLRTVETDENLMLRLLNSLFWYGVFASGYQVGRAVGNNYTVYLPTAGNDPEDLSHILTSTDPKDWKEDYDALLSKAISVKGRIEETSGKGDLCGFEALALQVEGPSAEDLREMVLSTEVVDKSEITHQVKEYMRSVSKKLVVHVYCLLSVILGLNIIVFSETNETFRTQIAYMIGIDRDTLFVSHKGDHWSWFVPLDTINLGVCLIVDSLEHFNLKLGSYVRKKELNDLMDFNLKAVQKKYSQSGSEKTIRLTQEFDAQNMVMVESAKDLKGNKGKSLVLGNIDASLYKLLLGKTVMVPGYRGPDLFLPLAVFKQVVRNINDIKEEQPESWAECEEEQTANEVWLPGNFVETKDSIDLGTFSFHNGRHCVKTMEGTKPMKKLITGADRIITSFIKCFKTQKLGAVKVEWTLKYNKAYDGEAQKVVELSFNDELNLIQPYVDCFSIWLVPRDAQLPSCFKFLGSNTTFEFEDYCPLLKTVKPHAPIENHKIGLKVEPISTSVLKKFKELVAKYLETNKIGNTSVEEFVTKTKFSYNFKDQVKKYLVLKATSICVLYDSWINGTFSMEKNCGLDKLALLEAALQSVVCCMTKIFPITLIGGPGGTGKSTLMNELGYTLVSFTKSAAEDNSAVTYQVAMRDGVINPAIDEGATASIEYLYLFYRRYCFWSSSSLPVISDLLQCIGGGNYEVGLSWLTRDKLTDNKERILYPLGKELLSINMLQEQRSIISYRQRGPFAQCLFDKLYNTNKLWKLLTNDMIDIKAAKPTRVHPMLLVQPYICRKNDNEFLQKFNPAAEVQISDQKVFASNEFIKKGIVFHTSRSSQGSNFDCLVHYSGEKLSEEFSLVGLTRARFHLTVLPELYQELGFGNLTDIKGERFYLPVGREGVSPEESRALRQNTVNLRVLKIGYKQRKLEDLAEFVVQNFKNYQFVDLSPGNKSYWSKKLTLLGKQPIIVHRSSFDIPTHAKCPRKGCKLPSLPEVKGDKKLAFIDIRTTTLLKQKSDDYEFVELFHLEKIVNLLNERNFVVLYKTSSPRPINSYSREVCVPTWDDCYKNYEWYWISEIKGKPFNQMGNPVLQSSWLGTVEPPKGVMVCPEPGDGVIEVWCSGTQTFFVRGEKKYLSGQALALQPYFEGDACYSLRATIHRHQNCSKDCSEDDKRLFKSLELRGVQNIILFGAKAEKLQAVDQDGNEVKVTLSAQKCFEWQDEDRKFSILSLKQPDICEEICSGMRLHRNNRKILAKQATKILKKAKMLPSSDPDERIRAKFSSPEEADFKSKHFYLNKDAKLVLNNYKPGVDERIIPKELNVGYLPLSEYPIDPGSTINTFLKRHLIHNESSDANHQFIAKLMQTVLKKCFDSDLMPKLPNLDTYLKGDYLNALAAYRVSQLMRIKDEPYNWKHFITYGAFDKNEVLLKDFARYVSNAHVKTSYHICPMVKPILAYIKDWCLEKSKQEQYSFIFTSGRTIDEVAEEMFKALVNIDGDYTSFDASCVSRVFEIFKDVFADVWVSKKWEDYLETFGTTHYVVKMKDKQRKLVRTIIDYVCFNGQQSGSPITTLMNTYINATLWALAHYISFGEIGLWMPKFIVGDDSGVWGNLKSIEALKVICDRLGMHPKLNFCPDLIEYNNHFLVETKDKTHKLVPKAARSLKRLFIQPTIDSSVPRKFTLNELFQLQASNYSERGALGSIPLIRKVWERSVEIFGEVKMSPQSYESLVKTKNPHRLLPGSLEVVELNDDFFDLYCFENFGLSGKNVKKLEKDYEKNKLVVGDVLLGKSTFKIGKTLEEAKVGINMLEHDGVLVVQGRTSMYNPYSTI